MSESTEPQVATTPEGMVEDLISGPAERLSKEREMGFQIVKNAMITAYAGKLRTSRANTLVRQSMLTAYKEAVDDAFKVFTKIIDEGEQRDIQEMGGL